MMTQPNLMVRTMQGSPYRTFDEFFSKHGVPTQVFSINPARRTTIVGKQGTRLTIFPFSLSDVFGNPVEGEVEIFLKEVFSKKEMVLSDKVTTSEDRLLESGGQFFVKACKNLRPLQLSQALSVQLPVREKIGNPLAMKLFVGSTAVTRAYRSKSAFDWKLASNKAVTVRRIGGKKYYSFDINEFNWWNCDYFFAKRTTRTMVSVKTNMPYDYFDDQAAYLIFKNNNSVARMYFGRHHFSSFNIPINLAAAVVVMGIRAGQLYCGKQFIPKTSGGSVMVQMEATTERGLLETLDKV